MGVAEVNHTTGEYRKKRTEERDETVAEVNHMNGEYRKKRTEERDETVAGNYRARLNGTDPQQINAEQYCSIILLDMIIQVVAGWYTLIGIIHDKIIWAVDDLIIWAVVGWYALLCIINGIPQASIWEDAYMKEQVQSENANYKKVSECSNEGEMKNYVGSEMKYDRKYEDWKGACGLKEKLPMQKTSDNCVAQDLCHNWFSDGKTSHTEDNQSFVKESKEIVAARKLGTAQRRTIERHAQQDVGKAKVKDKNMADAEGIKAHKQGRVSDSTCSHGYG